MQKKHKVKYWNVYTIVSFCLGILIAYLIEAFLHLALKLNSSNSIEVFSILINVVMGIILYLILEKKTGDDRAVKDLFHQDLKNIKDDFRTFMVSFNGGSLDAKYINNWFKLMSINITQFEVFLKSEFDFIDEECTLQKMNRDIQKVITNSKEFNDNFTKGKVLFSSETTSKVIELHKYLKHNFFRTSVKISRN